MATRVELLSQKRYKIMGWSGEFLGLSHYSPPPLWYNCHVWGRATDYLTTKLGGGGAIIFSMDPLLSFWRVKGEGLGYNWGGGGGG